MSVPAHSAIRSSCRKCGASHSEAEHSSHGINAFCDGRNDKTSSHTQTCEIPKTKQYYVDKYGFSHGMSLASMQSVVEIAHKNPDGVGAKNLKERERRMNELREEERKIDKEIERRRNDPEIQTRKQKDYEDYKTKFNSPEEKAKREQQQKRIDELAQKNKPWWTGESEEQYQARLRELKKDKDNSPAQKKEIEAKLKKSNEQHERQLKKDQRKARWSGRG